MSGIDDSIKILQSAQFAERMVARGLDSARKKRLDEKLIGSELLKHGMSILSGLPAEQCAPAVATMLRLLKEEIGRIQIQQQANIGAPPANILQ